jgi:hypothetical protein
MPYGEYIPTEDMSLPDRYSGLLWATIYEPSGKEISTAETYFEDLAKSHGKGNNEYTDLIRTVINNYCRNYVKLYCTDMDYHACQSGFGNEHCNGLIDFTTVQRIRAPSTLFGINNELYTITWTYSPGLDE